MTFAELRTELLNRTLAFAATLPGDEGDVIAEDAVDEHQAGADLAARITAFECSLAEALATSPEPYAASDPERPLARL